MPQRIQLRRARGWRKPAGAVVVSRPSRWGNPYPIGATVEAPDGSTVTVRDRAHSVALFRATPRSPQDIEQLREELGGRDLACWCPLDEPCHADVLLELANGPTRRP